MSIYEELKKLDWVKEPNDEAVKIYKKQVSSIQAIADTDWFKTIKEYWEREKESAIESFPTVKNEYLEMVQMRYDIANRFLKFLENLENAKQVV